MAQSEARQAVRAAGRKARKAMQGAARMGAERALLAHLRSLDLSSAASVGVFYADDGEPNLMPLIEELWTASVTVGLPVLSEDVSDRTMAFVPWLPGEQLRPGRFDIPIPAERPAIEPEVLLVSFVGFDSTGNRMGRGAGFFDRYLANSTAQIVGVGFEVQRFDAIPIEAHDKALPTVVTDLGIRFVETSANT